MKWLLVFALLGSAHTARPEAPTSADSPDTSSTQSKATPLPSPPKRPKNNYTHARAVETVLGEGATQCWIYEPSEPKPKRAPVVIFMHGYSAGEPDPYAAWIRHLVRQGCVVLYPRYQADLFTPPVQYAPNTVTAIRAALKILALPGHVRPDLSRVAIVGHSAGGIGALTYTLNAASEQLPIPKAVMVVHPGQGLKNGLQIIPLDDYSKLPADLQLVILVGEDDTFVGRESALRIWKLTGQISDRAFLTIPSDSHGDPALISHHLAPLAANDARTNALDWFAYWRTFDQLRATAFAKKPLSIATDLGRWSDGQPVKQLRVER
jgi:dienelactone hydrolase